MKGDTKMGTWGTALKESDAFVDIYSEFLTYTIKANNENWRLIDFRNEKSKHLESWTIGYKTSY